MASLKKSHASSGSSHSKAAKFKRYLPLYLMFLPGAIYLLINNYIPMAGIIVAFKKYNARLGIWKSPFCGLANSILSALGKDAVNWYAEPKYWPFILIFVNTWKGVGYGCLIYISTINGIDPSLYEAASLDGATKWQQIKNITLPFLKPTVITLTLMSVGRIFYSDFGLFYQVPRDSGLLYSATNVIDTYVYRGLMKSGNVDTPSFRRSSPSRPIPTSSNPEVRF